MKELVFALAEKYAAYMGALEGAKTYEAYRDTKAAALLGEFLKEVCRVIDADAAETLADEALKHIAAVSGELPAKAEDIDADARNAALLCKKKGVYPRYSVLLAAASINVKLADDKQARREEIAGLTGFEMEPELAYLVDMALAAIEKGEYLPEDMALEDLMRRGYEAGFAIEAKYGSCPQCVIQAFFTVTDRLDDKARYLYQAASALSGGVACCNDSACGAYTGANMVFSTFNGRRIEDLGVEGGRTTEPSNNLGRVVHDHFIEMYGSTICCNIHKKIFGRTFSFRYDTDNAFMEAGAHDDKCPAVVALATCWTCEVLYRNGFITA